MTNVTIGKIRIAKGTKFTQQYDCAAWHKSMTLNEDVTVDVKGNYKHYGHGEIKLNDGRIDDTHVCYTVEGIVDSSDFTSYFGSQAVASKVNEEVGETMRHTSSMYAHAVANGIVNGNSNITLNDDLRARKTYFVNKGEVVHSHGIFNKELDLCGTLMEFFKGRTFQWAKQLENGTIIAVELVATTKEYRIVELIGDVLYELSALSFDAEGWTNSSEVRDMYLSYK